MRLETAVLQFAALAVPVHRAITIVSQLEGNVSIHAKKLQRRFDRGESINTICKWYLKLEDAWAMPFRDLEPVEQELIKYMSSRFRVFLQERENPGSVAARTSTGSRLATILDQRLADTEHT